MFCSVYGPHWRCSKWVWSRWTQCKCHSFHVNDHRKLNCGGKISWKCPPPPPLVSKSSIIFLRILHIAIQNFLQSNEQKKKKLAEEENLLRRVATKCVQQKSDWMSTTTLCNRQVAVVLGHFSDEVQSFSP